jgi:hypothetical protein
MTLKLAVNYRAMVVIASLIIWLEDDRLRDGRGKVDPTGLC